MTIWTVTQLDLLKERFAAGDSASQIAAKLGGGLTRNAVIGKLHRLGLKARVRDAGRQERAAVFERSRQVRPTAPLSARPANPPTAKRRPAVANMPATPPIVPEVRHVHGNGVGLSALDAAFRMCRWILACDPLRRGRDRYCGQTVVGACSWCAHHRKLAYATAEQVRLRTAKERVARGFDEEGRRTRAKHHGKVGVGARAFGAGL